MILWFSLKLFKFSKIFNKILNLIYSNSTANVIKSINENKGPTGADFKKVELFLLKLTQKGLDKNLLNNKIQTIFGNNGLLRLNTRIGMSEMPEKFKNPIILPKGSIAVKLIMEKIHA